MSAPLAQSVLVTALASPVIMLTLGSAEIEVARILCHLAGYCPEPGWLLTSGVVAGL